MNTITHQDTQALHAAVFTATIATYDLLLIPLSQLRPSSRNVGGVSPNTRKFRHPTLEGINFRFVSCPQRVSFCTSAAH